MGDAVRVPEPDATLEDGREVFEDLVERRALGERVERATALASSVGRDRGARPGRRVRRDDRLGRRSRRRAARRAWRGRRRRNSMRRILSASVRPDWRCRMEPINRYRCACAPPSQPSQGCCSPSQTAAAPPHPNAFSRRRPQAAASFPSQRGGATPRGGRSARVAGCPPAPRMAPAGTNVSQATSSPPASPSTASRRGLVVRRGRTVVLRADLGRLRATARRARTSALASRFSGTYTTGHRQAPGHIPSTPRARSCASPRRADRAGRRRRRRRLQALRVRLRGRSATAPSGGLARLAAAPDQELRAGVRAARPCVRPPHEDRVPGAARETVAGTYTLLTETDRRLRAAEVSTCGAHGDTFVTAPGRGHRQLRRRAGAWRSSARWPTSWPLTWADDFAAPFAVADTSWIKPGRVAWSWWADSMEPAPARGRARTTWTSPQRHGLRVRPGRRRLERGLGPGAGGLRRQARRARCCCGPTGTRWPRRPSAPRPSTGWAAWGVAGVKADFLHSDSGERMAVIDDIAADAAARHLLVGFHGCTVPRGLQRTWPNVVTLRGRARCRARQVRPRRQPRSRTLTLGLHPQRDRLDGLHAGHPSRSAAGRVDQRCRPARAVDRLRVRAAALRRQPAAATARGPTALELLRDGPGGVGRHAAALRRARALGHARPALPRSLLHGVA